MQAYHSKNWRPIIWRWRMCKGVVNAWPAAVRESSYAAPVTTTGIQARSHAFCGNHACAPRRSNGSRCTSHRHGSAKICTSVCISDPIDEPGTPSDGNAPHQICILPTEAPTTAAILRVTPLATFVGCGSRQQLLPHHVCRTP